MIGALFALLGAAAGAIQAGLLARRAGGASHPLSFLARLGVVVVVLFVAARTGYLLWGAAGWPVGFGLGAAVAYRRLR